MENKSNSVYNTSINSEKNVQNFISQTTNPLENSINVEKQRSDIGMLQQPLSTANESYSSLKKMSENLSLKPNIIKNQLENIHVSNATNPLMLTNVSYWHLESPEKLEFTMKNTSDPSNLFYNTSENWEVRKKSNETLVNNITTDWLKKSEGNDKLHDSDDLTEFGGFAKHLANTNSDIKENIFNTNVTILDKEKELPVNFTLTFNDNIEVERNENDIYRKENHSHQASNQEMYNISTHKSGWKNSAVNNFLYSIFSHDNGLFHRKINSTIEDLFQISNTKADIEGNYSYSDIQNVLTKVALGITSGKPVNFNNHEKEIWRIHEPQIKQNMLRIKEKVLKDNPNLLQNFTLLQFNINSLLENLSDLKGNQQSIENNTMHDIGGNMSTREVTLLEMNSGIPNNKDSYIKNATFIFNSSFATDNTLDKRIGIVTTDDFNRQENKNMHIIGNPTTHDENHKLNTTINVDNGNKNIILKGDGHFQIMPIVGHNFSSHFLPSETKVLFTKNLINLLPVVKNSSNFDNFNNHTMTINHNKHLNLHDRESFIDNINGAQTEFQVELNSFDNNSEKEFSQMFSQGKALTQDKVSFEFVSVDIAP